MTRERWNQLMNNDELKLTQEEINDSWHFCWDWDGLLVGPEKDTEWGPNPKRCYCGYENLKGSWL